MAINTTSILFYAFLVIFAIPQVSQAGENPLEATAFQNEGTTDIDVLSGVSYLDGVWSPADVVPSGTITLDAYANGNDPAFLDAISLAFDPTGFDLTMLKLRCYLQKGTYVNPFWEHYQLLPGTKNPHNQDVGGAGPANFPPDVIRHSPLGTNLPSNTVVGWIEFPFDATSDPLYILPNGNIGLTLRLWNWRVDRVELLGTPATYPFSDFSVNRVKVDYDSDTNAKDSFVLGGEFTLAANSDGIDPLNEDVVVTLGTYSVTIQGGFVQAGHKYIFDGVVDGSDIRMEIKESATPAFTFFVKAVDVDLSETENPVDIEIVISDDSGSANVRLDGKLDFRAGKYN